MLQCTAAGDPFNAFDARVSWDPAALTPVPLVPSALQQGALMTDACGNTFHDFHPGVEADTISEILLCGGTFVTGPGPLYRLRFRAAAAPQVTVLHLSDAVFYHGGPRVTPVRCADAAIGIGVPVPLAVEDLAGPLALSIAPNPGRDPLRLTLVLPRAGGLGLDVFDLQGRLVRRLAGGWSPAGTRVLPWDGRDDGGRRLAPGVYVVSLRSETGALTRRAVLLP